MGPPLSMMQNLPILLAGLGCLLLMAVLWRPPPAQDEEREAPEIDVDDGDFE